MCTAHTQYNFTVYTLPTRPPYSEFKIGIDLSSFNPGNPRGIALCARHLFDNLKHILGGRVKGFHFDYDHSSSYLPGFGDWIRRRFIQLKWMRLEVQKQLNKNNIEVYHSLNFFLPKHKGIKGVTMFSDFFVHSHPQYIPAWYRLPAKYLYADSLNRAEAVIVPSIFTLNQITSGFPKYAGKIHYIPNGVSETFTIISNDVLFSDLRSKYRLPEKYLMYAGALDIRKNIDFVYEIYRRFKLKRPDSHPGLVIAGSEGLGYKGIPADLKTDPNVVHTGYVPDEDLAGLYNLADLFIFPSILEGFGIPPLEAMCCGTPAIVSDSTAVPEISGPGGLVLGLDSVDEWVEAADNILKDDTVYSSLRDRGLKWGNRFSWITTAKKTLEVYEKIF